MSSNQWLRLLAFGALFDEAIAFALEAVEKGETIESRAFEAIGLFCLVAFVLLLLWTHRKR